MPKKKQQEYNVLVRINVVTDVVIGADSWEDAVDQAKALEVSDACALTGDYIDGPGLILESISLIDV